MAGLGIIAFICNIFSIDVLPKTVCPYYAERLSNNYMYYDYYFSYVLVEFPFTRLCGLFNEPGYFGTFLGLFLVAEKLNLSKKGNIILLIAGIFTFSAAFFITLIIYLGIKLIYSRNIKLLIVISLTVAAVIAMNMDNDNVLRLLERFTFVDGKLNAINRTGDNFDRFFDNYIVSETALFGYGRGYLAYNQEIGNLSYKTYLVEYGLIACAVYWGGLLRYSIKYSNGHDLGIVFALLFMINIYQRPSVFIFGYMLLLFGGVTNISLRNDIKSI